ncbi:3' exoribonuclease family protein [Paracoccidioides lutzii Pb01]|uniref:Ribosomal RNA-processing protein 43 n=1 Tax=Paracoccidioides lutzii (strain ATCC MYA-826 / Pb01) TaxID=502779 RepID=C1H656_PARBA|nr:3' exoribonuclease family protein [Paracoccidioides lutzii Pb01]EEH35119.1 3' exoribonuclease family protein [Paracoccidioides lutzii Pb01]
MAPAPITATSSLNSDSSKSLQGPPPSLSLPPSQFARLQPHAYLLAHLSPPSPDSRPPLRVNGRSTCQFRPVSVNTGSLTHTNASAVVRTGDTVVVCGVRGEILSTDDIAAWNVSSSDSTSSKRRRTGGAPVHQYQQQKQQQRTNEETEESDGDDDDDDDDDDSEIRDFNLLVPNLSLSTGCAPGISPSAPPSALAQSLSHKLLCLLHSTRLIRASDLRILHHQPDLTSIATANTSTPTQPQPQSYEPEPETKAFWTLYIDVLIISHAGNLFDAAWGAVVAALHDTRLPKAWWDMDRGMVLCSDDVAEARPLRLRGLPIASSFAVFEADEAERWKIPMPVGESGVDMDSFLKRPVGEMSVGGEGRPRRWILADPDAFEESLCAERVCVVVDKGRDGEVKIWKLEKNGGLAVGRREVRELAELATGKWEEWKGLLVGR